MQKFHIVLNTASAVVNFQCAPRNTSPCRPCATTPSSMHKCKCMCAFSVAPKRCTNNTPPLRPAAAVLVLAPAVARCTSRIAIPATRFMQSEHQRASRARNAAFRKAIKTEMYAISEMVSDPLKVFDMAPQLDGATALVLTRHVPFQWSASTRKDSRLCGIV